MRILRMNQNKLEFTDMEINELGETLNTWQEIFLKQAFDSFKETMASFIESLCLQDYQEALDQAELQRAAILSPNGSKQHNQTQSQSSENLKASKKISGDLAESIQEMNALI